MKNKSAGIALTLVLMATCISLPASAACEVEGQFPYTDPFGIEQCPEELNRWMQRLNACTEHAQAFGIPGMSDEEMEKREWAMIDLECCKTGCDYYDLKEKYAENPSYIGVLDQYAKRVHGEDQNPECIKPGSELEKKYGLNLSATPGERPAHIPETTLPGNTETMTPLEKTSESDDSEQ
ncbi:MAG: hypothetical protein R3E13_02755 [Alphaproteobacteria bacterium]